MSIIRVLRITQTCAACPSQWEGTTADGRMIYARYRWGHLTIGVGDTMNDAVEGAMDWEDTSGESVFSEQLGDEFDGYLSLAELIEATRGVVEWAAA